MLSYQINQGVLRYVLQDYKSNTFHRTPFALYLAVATVVDDFDDVVVLAELLEGDYLVDYGLLVLSALAQKFASEYLYCDQLIFFRICRKIHL